MNRQIIKGTIILFAVIIISAIGARVLAGGETLAEYAENSPETVTTENAKVDNENTDASNDKGTDSNGKSELAEQSNITDTTSNNSSNSVTNSPSENNTSETSSNDDKATSESANSTSASSNDEQSASSSERVTYMDGFYYEPISNDVFKRISGISYPVDCTVSTDELRYVSLLYNDFSGNTATGELICNKELAQDVVEIFYELYTNGYQIESIKLIDEFNGDDHASMLANNTSCFNYRVVDGTTKLSNHATGRAIDINPFYNPYITYKKDGSVNISPEGSEPYADRAAEFPYKIDENDLAYKLFKEHGFAWGGNWNSCKDYQHFEKK